MNNAPIVQSIYERARRRRGGEGLPCWSRVSDARQAQTEAVVLETITEMLAAAGGAVGDRVYYYPDPKGRDAEVSDYTDQPWAATISRVLDAGGLANLFVVLPSRGDTVLRHAIPQDPNCTPGTWSFCRRPPTIDANAAPEPESKHTVEVASCGECPALVERFDEYECALNGAPVRNTATGAPATCPLRGQSWVLHAAAGMPIVETEP